MPTVIGFKRREIRMWCDTAGQPVYLEGSDWSDLNMRERQPHEPVHLKDEQHDACDACGKFGGIWLQAPSSHAIHPAKCV